MIKGLAYIFANYFARKGEYPKEKINIYAYGFELLISTILNAFGLFIISIVMGLVIEAILFSLAFILLRATAGGYHAKHNWSCFLITNSIFVIFAIILKLMASSVVLPYIVFITLLTSIIIWSFSPIRAENNPLHENQKNSFRMRSIIIATVNMALTIVFAFLLQLPIIYLAYYQSGAFAAAISLAVAAIAIKIKI